MNSLENNRTLIENFIESIWNQGNLNDLRSFLHPDFVDYSLPPAMLANQDGLKEWVAETGKSFEHHTVIDAHVTEGNKSMIKFTMNLKHIGIWRDIEPTGFEIQTIGYRYFKIIDNRIMEHWALLDGNSIENQLKSSTQGCKVQQ